MNFLTCKGYKKNYPKAWKEDKILFFITIISFPILMGLIFILLKLMRRI